MDILSYKLGQNSIEPDKPDQDKTATPSTQQQIIRADAGYELASVTIEAIQTETTNVTPSTSSQTITPTTGKFINEINVSAVTSSIDNNITAENIKKDVVILGTTGTYETHTGAYKVANTTEMNAIEDMQEGDYCIIDTTTEYVIPETATFTRFTGTPTDLLNGEYSNYLFLIRDDNYGGTTILTDEKENIRTGSYTWWGCRYINKTFTNDTLTFTIDDTTKKQVFIFEHQSNNTLAVKSLNKKYIIKEPNKDSFTNSTTNFNDVNMFINEFIYNTSSHNYTIKICNASGTPYNKTFSTGYNSDNYKKCLYVGTSTNNIMLYACPMQEITTDHKVYRYETNSWVDVTDDILVETTNVTPTTSSQTLSIPAGYEGFKEVNISAVDNTIDSNIIAKNIKDGVTILGVTGTYTGE